MRAKWRSRVLVLSSLGPALVGAGDVWAGHHGSDVYVAPTAYVVDTVPTAYVAPVSYVVPTTYVNDSPAYVPASYVLSPAYAYVPTAYRRRLRSASYVLPAGYVLPTNYVATSVVYPTVFETQTVSNSCDPCAVTPPCCETGVAQAPAPQPRQETHRSSVPPLEPTPATRPTPSTVESAPAEPTEPAPAPAASASAEPTMRRDTSPAPGRTAAGRAVDPNYPTPPEVPAREKEAAPAPAPAPSTPITSTPAGGDATPPKRQTPPPPPPQPTPPVAPGAEGSPLDLPQGGESGAVRHQVQKPAGASPYLRTVAKGDLHKLEGKVISTETGRPEEGSG